MQPQIHERKNHVLEHGQHITGPEDKELEEKLQDYRGAKYCISVASGTEALLISLMALGIQPGDELTDESRLVSRGSM
jgi:UDP-2-acetamido-2-deoxy-ribo-hexuluronate aminotransferase